MLCKDCPAEAEPRSLRCKACQTKHVSYATYDLCRCGSRKFATRVECGKCAERTERQSRIGYVARLTDITGHPGDRNRLKAMLFATRTRSPFDARVLDAAAALRSGVPVGELIPIHGRIVVEAARGMVR